MTTDTNPLEATIADIDLSYPIAPAAIYPLQISEASVVPNKRGDGNNLLLKWKSTTEIISTKGEAVAAGGIVMSQYIGLTSSPKRTSAAINKDIARLAIGARLPKDTKIESLKADPSPLVGKIMPIKVGIRAETSEFPESNEVKSVVLEA